MPRILPVLSPDESQNQTFDELLSTRRRIPTMYGILAHHPEILKAHRAYFRAALDSGRLDRAFKEKIAYRVALVRDSSYSSASHRRYALELGVPDSQLRAIEVGDFSTLERRERAALELADAAASSSGVSDRVFDALSTHFAPAEQVEISALIGVMILASSLGEIFDLEPDSNGAPR